MGTGGLKRRRMKWDGRDFINRSTLSMAGDSARRVSLYDVNEKISYSLNK